MTLWKGLLSAFDRDLWDMPYRIVLNKLRMGTSQLVGTLPPVTVREIMEVLFPTGTGKFDLRPSLVRWDDSLAVAGDEISAACAKINAGKASGSDGIMGQIIKNTSGILTDLWMSCFKACLREGVFPAAWKMAISINKETRETRPCFFVIQADLPTQRGEQIAGTGCVRPCRVPSGCVRGYLGCSIWVSTAEVEG